MAIGFTDHALERDLKIRSWMLESSAGYWVFVNKEHQIVAMQQGLVERMGYGLASTMRNLDMSILSNDLPDGHEKMVAAFIDQNKAGKVLRSRTKFTLSHADGARHEAIIKLHPFDPILCDGICFHHEGGEPETLCAAEIFYTEDLGL